MKLDLCVYHLPWSQFTSEGSHKFPKERCSWAPKLIYIRQGFSQYCQLIYLKMHVLDENEENGAKNADSTIDDCWMTQGRRWRQVPECNDVNGMVKSPKVNGQEQLGENKIQVEARMQSPQTWRECARRTFGAASSEDNFLGNIRYQHAGSLSQILMFSLRCKNRIFLNQCMVSFVWTQL